MIVTQRWKCIAFFSYFNCILSYTKLLSVHLCWHISYSASVKSLTEKFSFLYLQMLFCISFEKHEVFIEMLTACSDNHLDVTDTKILEKDAIVFYNVVSFLNIINTVLERGFEARVHFINVD